MNVVLTWTTPATRAAPDANGTPVPLTLAEISRTEVKRNGTVIGTPTAVTGQMTFTDSAPLTGSDVYTVDTVTTDGLVSADSNSVSITVPNANPAAAITDLAGVLNTP